MIAKPIKVKALKKYIIWLKYNDGTEGKINLSHLAGKGVFKKWDTKNNFSNVYIDKESKAISWNEIIQLCPDSLYLKLKGTSFEKWRSENKIYGANK
jgi:hypothetical protein